MHLPRLNLHYAPVSNRKLSRNFLVIFLFWLMYTALKHLSFLYKEGKVAESFPSRVPRKLLVQSIIILPVLWAGSRVANRFWKTKIFRFVFWSFSKTIFLFSEKKRSFLKTTNSFWIFRKRIMIVFENYRL